MSNINVCIKGWNSPFNGKRNEQFSHFEFIVPWGLLFFYFLQLSVLFSSSFVSSLLLSSSSCFSCSSCVASSASATFPVFFISIHKILWSLSRLLVGEVRSIVSSLSLVVLLELIASRTFKQAWYPDVFSEKPISWIKDFRLGFDGDISWSGGESMLNLTGCLSLFASPIVLNGMRSPKAFANVDWRWRTDRLVGIVVAEVDVVAGGVFFWFKLFGEGVDIPDVVDEFSLSFSLAMVVSCGWAFPVPFVALDFSIVSRLNPRGLLQARPPAGRPVGLARRLVGLFCSAACSRLVNFLASPVSKSSLNNLWWGAVESLMSKKRRQGLDILADFYAT